MKLKWESANPTYRVKWVVERGPTITFNNIDGPDFKLSGPIIVLDQSSSFGFTQITDGSEDPFTLQPDVKTPITNDGQGELRERLKNPFFGHDFVQGGEFVPRALDDVYELNVGFTVTSDVSELTILFGLGVGEAECVETFPLAVRGDACEPLRQTVTMTFYASEAMVLNNAGLVATSTAYAEIADVVWLIVPKSTP